MIDIGHNVGYARIANMSMGNACPHVGHVTHGKTNVQVKIRKPQKRGCVLPLEHHGFKHCT